jgi:ACT domain-containing protein
MRVVLTVIGKDKVGIIAGVSNTLAECNINIININQNIMQGFFNMVLIGDMSEASVSLQDAKEKVHALGEKLGVEIRMQSEEIFTAMHRV